MPQTSPSITFSAVETAAAAGMAARRPVADAGKAAQPSPAQRRYLELGRRQPGGKLPLFDRQGQEIDAKTVRSCIARGWAEPWFDNPVKPDWIVCRLTAAGRAAVGGRD